MAVISKFLNPDTKKPITNVEVVRKMDKILTKLKNSNLPKDKIDYEKLINGEEEIYEWIHEVASLGDTEAQKRIAETLIPIK